MAFKEFEVTKLGSGGWAVLASNTDEVVVWQRTKREAERWVARKLASLAEQAQFAALMEVAAAADRAARKAARAEAARRAAAQLSFDF